MSRRNKYYRHNLEAPVTEFSQAAKDAVQRVQADPRPEVVMEVLGPLAEAKDIAGMTLVLESVRFTTTKLATVIEFINADESRKRGPTMSFMRKMLVKDNPEGEAYIGDGVGNCPRNIVVYDAYEWLMENIGE